MCPVAKRFFLAALAAAPGHGLRFGDHFDDGAHADFFVGTVAKGLFLGFTAGAPCVAARLHFQDKRGVLGVGEFFSRCRIFQIFISSYFPLLASYFSNKYNPVCANKFGRNETRLLSVMPTSSRILIPLFLQKYRKSFKLKNRKLGVSYHS